MKGVNVIGGHYYNNGFTPDGPCAGIDIEPNYNSYCEGVVLQGVRTSGNLWAGIQNTPVALTNTVGRPYTVTMIGCTSDDDGLPLRGGATGGLVFANGGVLGVNKIPGFIKVDNCLINNAPATGASFIEWCQERMPRVEVDGLTIHNPGSDSASLTNEDLSGVYVKAPSIAGISYFGGIDLKNVRTVDTRATKKATFNILLGTVSGKVCRDIRIERPSSDTLATSPGGLNISGGGWTQDLDVAPLKKYVDVATTPSDLRQYAGQTIVSTANFGLITLPSAPANSGMEFEILCASSATVCQINVDPADAILGVGAAGKNATIQPGGVLKIVASSAGWLVVNKIGVATIP